MPLRTNPLTMFVLYYPLSLSSHSTDHPPSNMPTFSYAAVIRSYIHECVHCETQYPDTCSWILMPSCDLHTDFI